MKKTLSLFLAVLMMLSVFTVAAFAAKAPELTDVECTYEGISLTWAAGEDVVNYIVYREDGDGEFFVIATTNETEFFDDSVEENATYTYKISAQFTDGKYLKPAQIEGETIVYKKPYCAHKSYTWVIDYKASAYASGKKHKECKNCHANIGEEIIPQLAPDTPVLSSVTVMQTSIVVKWDAVGGATSYVVYRKLVGGKWEILGTTTSLRYTDKSVVSGKSYHYTVKARNVAGLSGYKASAAVKFFAAPANIAAANATSTIKVTWDAVKGASVYRVYRKLVGETSWTYIGNSKTTSFVDKKVTAADNYVYTVRAGDGKVYGSYYKDAATIVRLDVPTLSKPVSSKDGITVKINQVEGAKGYDIYRKTADSSWVRIGRVNNTRSTAYLDKGTQKGVTYTYTIRAYNGTSRSYYNTKGVSVKDAH